jgi:hypothetical protein
MAGFDPAIFRDSATLCQVTVGARITSGHDEDGGCTFRMSRCTGSTETLGLFREMAA